MMDYMSSVSMTPVQLTCRYPLHPYAGNIRMSMVFRSPVIFILVGYKAVDAKYTQLIFELQMLIISTNISKCKVSPNHFENGSDGIQTLIRDHLNLHLFQMHKELPKERL